MPALRLFPLILILASCPVAEASGPKRQGPEAPAAALAGAPLDNPIPVRSSTRWGVSLTAEGCRRSPTLRELVRRLGASDVIVYVQPASQLPRGTDGYLSFSGRSGGFRYLRVSLRRRLARPRLIALLAHELQHAREVAEARDVVDEKSFRAFYERVGDVNEHGFDTQAAREVGYRVVDELTRPGGR